MIEMKSKLEGVFSIRAVSAKGEVRELAEFPNLILDAGLRYMGMNSNYLNYCSVGSGSSTPIPSQTTLDNRLYTTSTDTPGVYATGANNEDPDNPYVFRRVGKRFAPQGSPYNISELGFGWDSNGTLFNRALVRDLEGNPTSLSILGDEFLDVVYELRLYPPVQDFVGTMTPTGIDTTPRSYIVRARGDDGSLTYNSERGWTVAEMLRPRGNNWDYLKSGPIGPLFGEPTGNSLSLIGSAVMDPSGASGVYTLQAPPPSANFTGGIRSAVAAMYSAKYQFEFDPPFMKTSDDVFRFSFRHSWGRRGE